EGAVVLPMDCDNDHSDAPEEWVTPEKMAAETEFGDISFAAYPSKSNLLPKGNKSPRPRNHYLFVIENCTDADTYADLKRKIQEKYPFFDPNALDSARFLFGNEVEPEDVFWNEGWLTIVDILDDGDLIPGLPDEEDFDAPAHTGPIMEGSRNKTLSHYAGRILKKYGLSDDRAYEVFSEYVAKCDPPLPAEEVATIWSSACRFYKKKVMTAEDYVPPEEYNDDFGNGSMKPEDYSDIGEAKILTREYGNELKYTAATDYLRFDGDCWREDKQLAVGATEEFLDLQLADAEDAVEAAIKALVSAGIEESVVRAGGRDLEKACDTPKLISLFYMWLGAKNYLKFVQKRRDYKYIVSTMNAAKPMLAIQVSSLDKDPFLINTPESTIDMNKGMSGKRDHDPKDYITKITACGPSEVGKKIWEDALVTFFQGDKELIDYVQMTVGSAAVGKVFQEHMIIAYGGGANGKSTFWNTIYRVLGNYAGKISAEALTMNCKRNVKPEMAELKGKRLIIASEMEEGMRLNTATVKQLCSTDEIQAEKKYKDPFSFVPSHTLVLYTNHLPKVGANDDGIWRRLVVIPFNAKITGKSDIKNYADYLFDHAGGYVMTWIIEGAKKAIEADFKIKEPQIVQAAIEAYREENDWLGQFLDECCDIGKDLTAKSGELYQAYRARCTLNGEYIRSTSDFYSSMEKAGYSKRKTNKGAFILGLALKDGQDFLE
ncbi:MAG: phage/plasmid primase, P4 family, partial [Eubacteriales bacterium]|nr:phage/plasmid primase, P4 family [Eubacteriales bacterium]